MTLEWWMGDSVCTICPFSSVPGLGCTVFFFTLMPSTTIFPVFVITCHPTNTLSGVLHADVPISWQLQGWS